MCPGNHQRITAAVAPYASRGSYDTPHSADTIYAAAGGSSAELKLVKRGGGLRGYAGTIAIGVLT